jgi:flagellar L-ring protein precursor FlgH
MKRALSLLILVSVTIGAASSASKNGKDQKKKKPPEPTALESYVKEAMATNSSPEAAHPAGSIWSPNARFANLGMDLKASRTNDLVTIVVTETTSAVATGDVKTARTSSAQSAIQAAGGITRAAGPWANLAKTNTATALQGQGSTDRGATVTTTVSARVVTVLPNGYLVVEGIKRVQVNSENQIVTIRGVVRPVDLDVTNSIPSDRVAQMEIQVNGKGVINDSIHRPWFLYRLLLGLLPF